MLALFHLLVSVAASKQFTPISIRYVCMYNYMYMYICVLSVGNGKDCDDLEMRILRMSISPGDPELNGSPYPNDPFQILLTQ